MPRGASGRSLVPTAFNLAIEPLLACLWCRLGGVKLPGLTFKVSAFADDVLVGAESGADFQVAQDCLSLYRAASNARLNADKCQTLVLGGAVAGGMPVLGQLLENLSVFTYLGIPFHGHCFPLPALWYEKCLSNLSNVISN